MSCFKRWFPLVVVAVFFVQCEDRLDESVETQSTQDNSKMQSEFDDINSTVERYLNKELNQGAKLAEDSCPVVTLNSATKRLVIDFGTSCMDAYGNERTGKIIADYTGGYKEAGSVITVALEDYSVNGDQITGTKTVTNQGTVNGFMQWKVEVSNAMITTSSGEEITWQSTRYRALVESGQELNPYDQVYHIWGSASGIDRAERSFETTIAETTPLVLDQECWITTRLPISGVIDITPEGLTKRSIDYGEGTCDRAVTLIVGNQSIELSL